MHLADPYRPGVSFWHRANPKAKLLIVIVYILAVSLLPAGWWLSLALLAGLLWAGILSAQLGPAWLLRRSLLAFPFVLAALPLPFTVAGAPIVPGWPISQEGVLRLVTILLKSWLSVQAVLLLVGATPFHAILWGLHGLRVPRLLVAVTAMMYRYLFVLGDEAGRLMRARAARSALAPGHRKPGLWQQARTAGNMVGVLFVRAIERSERIYAAMLARGYAGQVHLLEPPAWTGSDTRLMVLAGAALFAILLLDKAF